MGMGGSYRQNANLQIHIHSYFLDPTERMGGRPKTKWREELDQFLLHKNFHRLAQVRSEWERVRYTFALLGPGVHSFQNFDRFAFTRE